MRRWTRRVLVGLVGLGVALGVGYCALLAYLQWHESVSPSVGRVLVLPDGRRVPLLQPGLAANCGATGADCSASPGPVAARPSASPAFAPTLRPTQVPNRAAPPTPDPIAESPPASWAGAPDPAAASVLPPERLVIPSIDVDRPVVLSDNEQMPRFPGVGWLMGSAFPGQPGNLVLFGHLDGRYATLGRLKELQPGDEFSVRTTAQAFRYRVRTLTQVTPDDVRVLLPTAGPTATLITCSGRWDPRAQMYDHRLIVTADYVGADRPSDGPTN